jgi:hypothetical protein
VNGAPIGAVNSNAARGGSRPERFWLEVVAVRVSRLVGSLQVAVFLLIWFAFVLAIGTVVESWYSGKIAQELVYRTWWFKLLLLLLGLNIFFAAAKKWPWKKYQTGFLITHVGLLMLVAGGAVTSFSGTDGLMSLIDTSQANIQRANRLGQESSQAVLTDEATLRIRKVGPGSKEDEPAREFRFEPGSLAWRPDQYLTPQVHPLLQVLNWLDHPLPRTWEADFGNGQRLSVLAFYPHARQEDFSPAKSDEPGEPAVKIRLKSAVFGRVPREPWLGGLDEDRVTDLGPAMIEMLGRCPSSLLDEFLHPPPTHDLGAQGQLVLILDGKTYRFRVDKSRDRALDVGGYQLRITRYIPDFKGEGDGSTPVSPVLDFELTKDGKTTRYMTPARYAGMVVPFKDGRPTMQDPNHIRAWYHPPDYRYGRGSHVRGLLQFAVGDTGQLYYRSFASSSADFSGFGFEKSAEVNLEQGPYPIWKGMNWEFQLREFLPRAVARPRWVPEDARPGLQSEFLSPAIRCQLSSGADKSEEFWLAQRGGVNRVTLGKETYDVSFNELHRPLDFEIKLLRAEQTVDAGTQQAASYASYVQLTDDGSFSTDWVPLGLRPLTNFLGLTSGGERIDGQDRVIWMNHPLDHRGYKLYQSSYQFLKVWDNNDKPVSFSAFTVSRDPGLWLKYLGSTMLALGIACMFYMKAYFFKPRGRTVSAGNA